MKPEASSELPDMQSFTYSISLLKCLSSHRLFAADRQMIRLHLSNITWEKHIAEWIKNEGTSLLFLDFKISTTDEAKNIQFVLMMAQQEGRFNPLFTAVPPNQLFVYSLKNAARRL